MNWTDILGVLSCVLTLGAARCARVRQRPGPPPLRRSTGRVVLLLGMAVPTAVSSFAVSHGPPALRVALVLVALLVAPGYAVVVFRGLDDVIDELALALALSFAMLVLAGTALASVGLWEPAMLAALSTLVTAPVLAWHGIYHFLLPVAARTATPACD